MKFLNTPILNIIEGEAIIIAKINGQIVSCNTEALQLYQYPSIHTIKQHTLIDLMPDDFAPLFPKEITPEHLNVNGYFEHVGRRKDGALFPCKIHTHYQNFGDKKYLIGHVREDYKEVDIEKRCLQQNIVVLKRELKAEQNKNHELALLQSSKQLSKCYPTLSANDLKICHYLTLNYSSKHISRELSITTDGVFAARKRIRKKIGLLPTDDLVKTLLKCQKQC